MHLITAARFRRATTSAAIAIAIVAIAAVSVLALAGCAGGAAEPTDTIGINALTSDPQAFSGEIAIEGIVQAITPDTSVISLIDVTEFESCGLTPCEGAGILPLFVPTSGQPAPSGALYGGTPPALEDRVVAVGTVREGDAGLYFDVERIVRGSSTLLEKQ